MDDPTLALATTVSAWVDDAGLTAYQLMERALCTCDPDAGLDTCGWDRE